MHENKFNPLNLLSASEKEKIAAMDNIRSSFGVNSSSRSINVPKRSPLSLSLSLSFYAFILIHCC
jgi:hypothetical protein